MENWYKNTSPHTPHPTPHTPHPHFLEKIPGLKLFDRCLGDFCDRG
ncbi:hypothetical protein BFG60_4408 [Microcystis aeruginosa NIES-98]|nr:hypothetical protein BFG60_4408 [Microcystis aeruginosa NIES-98]